MAKRPIFIPTHGAFPFVREYELDFEWFPGFALSQTQKSIHALHVAAAKNGISPVLEISTKSTNKLGVSLSAFNLKLIAGGIQMPVECAFQGSKVFEGGGPFTDLYKSTSREAKTDVRLRTSGRLIGFNFLGEDFPTQPVTAFYDWLYLMALRQNLDLANELGKYRGFTDIAFNPAKSLNCQASSAALYVALLFMDNLDWERLFADKSYYLELITGKANNALPSVQLKLF